MNYREMPFYLNEDDISWVENTLSAMTTDEKINQIFVDMLWNEPEKKVAEIAREKGLGGFRYNNQSPEKTLLQNQTIQKNSKIPALIAANVEAGGNGAVKGGTKLGEGIAVAATRNLENAYYMGYYGCKEAVAVGCNWTFAPIVDIDLNWRNCVIPTRCFGNDWKTVLNMGLEYMRGAKDAGVACCMKHFPGDGCDERDQHLAMTVNDLSCEEWDDSFGKVYKGMIDAGVPSIMIGHIAQPAYSRKFKPDIKDEEIMPATISPELLQNLLREKLGFNGLIITDATHMVGITAKKRRAEFIPEMITSGCDMILYYRDYEEDMGYVKAALKDGRITTERLNEAVRTILAFKAMLKLHIKQKDGTLIPDNSGLSVVGCDEHKRKAAEIIDQSITLVKNTKNQLPITPQTHKKIIIYPVENSGIKGLLTGKKNAPANILAEELRNKGFEVTVFKLNYLKYISPRGINGKRALAETTIEKFKEMYDAAIILAHVSSFSVTNERSLHWRIPMGPEVPWYASEIPTIGISVAHPFHLLDLPMVPTYINTYNSGREAIRQTVEKLMGISEFKGESPVDAFCGMWDTRI